MNYRKLSFLFCLIFITQFISAQVVWLDSYDDAMEKARKENKLIVVDCWATWCGPCNRMDDDVWEKNEMSAFLDQFIFVKLDLSSGFNNSYFSVDAVPTVIITDGWKMTHKEKKGYQSLSQMKKLLKDYRFPLQDLYQKKFLYEKDHKDAKNLMALAIEYQKCFSKAGREARSNLKSLSNQYYKKAQKIMKKRKQKKELVSCQLMCSLNKQAKKRLKILNQIKCDCPENDNLKQAIKVKTYLDLKDVSKAKSYFVKLKDYKFPYYDFIGDQRKMLN
jgi:thiol-disulfide isomerase/thioredoxin